MGRRLLSSKLLFVLSGCSFLSDLATRCRTACFFFSALLAIFFTAPSCSTSFGHRTYSALLIATFVMILDSPRSCWRCVLSSYAIFVGVDPPTKRLFSSAMPISHSVSPFFVYGVASSLSLWLWASYMKAQTHVCSVTPGTPMYADGIVFVIVFSWHLHLCELLLDEQVQMCSCSPCLSVALFKNQLLDSAPGRTHRRRNIKQQDAISSFVSPLTITRVVHLEDSPC